MTGFEEFEIRKRPWLTKVVSTFVLCWAPLTTQLQYLLVLLCLWKFFSLYLIGTLYVHGGQRDAIEISIKWLTKKQEKNLEIRFYIFLNIIVSFFFGFTKFN